MNKLYIVLFLFVSVNFSWAQQISQPKGEEYLFNHTECLNDIERNAIMQKISSNIDSLKALGKIVPVYSQSQVLFAWPMQFRTGVNEYGYHSISAGVDHNPAYPNQLLDYNCGTRTYDTPSGYNHAGTDFFLWPFQFNKMDSSDVEIISGAPGTIVYKSNGNYDRNCASNNGNWNAVYVQHADGSVAWYGHMKNGSLTNKTVGQTVTQGEYLGVVGSSGNSSGPHLHLELYDSGNNLIDPFYGPCNSMNNSSWWINQRPYIDAGINHIVTNYAPPIFNACPNQDTKRQRNFFTNTDTIYLMLYFRFLSNGDSVQYKIYRPNNSIWGQWWFVHSGQNFNAAWYYYWAILGSSEPSGQWKYEVNYKNQTYFYHFFIGTSGLTENDEPLHTVLFPNPNSGGFSLQLAQNNVLDFSNDNYQLVFYDIVGNELKTEPITQALSNYSVDFSKGFYTYAVFKNGKKLSTGKFILN